MFGIGNNEKSKKNVEKRNILENTSKHESLSNQKVVLRKKYNPEGVKPDRVSLKNRITDLLLTDINDVATKFLNNFNSLDSTPQYSSEKNDINSAARDFLNRLEDKEKVQNQKEQENISTGERYSILDQKLFPIIEDMRAIISQLPSNESAFIDLQSALENEKSAYETLNAQQELPDFKQMLVHSQRHNDLQQQKKNLEDTIQTQRFDSIGKLSSYLQILVSKLNQPKVNVQHEEIFALYESIIPKLNLLGVQLEKNKRTQQWEYKIPELDTMLNKIKQKDDQTVFEASKLKTTNYSLTDARFNEKGKTRFENSFNIFQSDIEDLRNNIDNDELSEQNKEGLARRIKYNAEYLANIKIQKPTREQIKKKMDAFKLYGELSNLGFSYVQDSKTGKYTFTYLEQKPFNKHLELEQLPLIHEKRVEKDPELARFVEYTKNLTSPATSAEAKILQSEIDRYIKPYTSEKSVTDFYLGSSLQGEISFKLVTRQMFENSIEQNVLKLSIPSLGFKNNLSKEASRNIINTLKIREYSLKRLEDLQKLREKQNAEFPKTSSDKTTSDSLVGVE
jgi:hypothetical protein